jgi:DNA-binding NarL/FixJ family response regulator
VERTIRILIADDHAVFREGLRFVLGSEPDMEVVGEADTGKAVVERTADLGPDVVLMDIQMPETNGIEATRRILGANRDVGVVVLTMFEDDDSVFSAMRAVAEGDAYFGAEIARRLTDFFSTSRACSPAEPFPELTAREREVLDLIAQGNNNAKITRLLFVSPKTVRNHISNIFTKLQIADRTQAILRAREAGLGGDAHS